MKSKGTILRIQAHDRWAEMYEVPSESNPNTAYVVALDARKHSWACSCPRWIFHTPRTECKHIKAVLALKAGGQPQAVSAPAILTEAKLTSMFALLEKE